MLAWGQLARPGPKLPKLDREPTILFPLADRQIVCSARNMRAVFFGVISIEAWSNKTLHHNPILGGETLRGLKQDIFRVKLF